MRRMIDEKLYGLKQQEAWITYIRVVSYPLDIEKILRVVLLEGNTG